MKIIKYLLVAFLIVNMISCKPSEKKEASTEEILPANLTTANINIKGMTCEIGCAKTIESKISKLEGVTDSKVIFEEGKGIFVFDSNKTSEEKIVSTINNLLDGKTYSANVSTKACKPECEKACCVTDKKICEPGCEKPCCSSEVKECKPGCEKPCCVTKK